jgi:tetratricopeptide (TPR) repeat protein
LICRLLSLSGLALLLTANVVAAQSVTRSTFRVMEDVQKLIEEDRHDEAMSRLDELVIATKNIPYDYALANQYLAHTSIILDQPAKARKALEAALGSQGLPVELVADLKLFYGTILLGDEEFAAAAEALEDWLAVEEAPTAKQLFSMAYAQYMNGALERAETLMARIFGTDPRPSMENSWYQVYYRILFDLKKYTAGEELLFELLSRDPANEQHWRLLASHYLQLEESNDALAALMLSYWSDLVADAEDLKRIVSLYGFVDVPEKAARLLETWLDEKRIPADADSLKQLGNLWLMARNREKAKSAMEKAASASTDGQTFQLLGGIHFEDEDWVKAHAAYKRALRLGGLDEPLRISLLAGISAYRAGMKEEARTALQEAARSGKYKAQAEGLLRRLDDA